MFNLKKRPSLHGDPIENEKGTGKINHIISQIQF